LSRTTPPLCLGLAVALAAVINVIHAIWDAVNDPLVVYTLATPFWAKYTLRASPQAPSIIFATVFVVAILAVSLWSRLLRRWGVKRTWLWAVAVMLSSATVMGLASNLVIGVLGAAIAGAGLGGIKVCREMIMANLVDLSLARTSHRQEGIYYSLLRFFGKLSKLLEALAAPTRPSCTACSTGSGT
jgi:GPH family glycoside/pentoside/hexuronide:cation symporter